MDSKHLLFCPLTKVLGPSLKKLGQRSLNNRLLVFSERRPVPWPRAALHTPVVFACLSFLRKRRPLANCYIAVTRGICFLLVFPVGEKTMKRRIGPACLSFLSKKDQGPGQQVLPGLACLFYLKELRPLGEAACFSDRRGRKDCLLVFSI